MAGKATQILKAAERLFASGRYDEVTLDEICRRAGVGKGTIYRYFQDKEGLYWQVILSGLDELTASVERLGEKEQDPGAGLQRVAACIAGFFTERSALLGLMWSARLRKSGRHRRFWRKWHSREEKMLGTVSSLVAKGMEQGLYATRLSPAAAGRLFLAMLRTGLWNRQEMPGGKDWHLCVVELFENGLLVRAAENTR